MAILSFPFRFRAVATFIGLLAVCILPSHARIATCAGTLDPSFAPTLATANAFVPQGNQVITATSGAVVRLRDDGSLDETFLVSVSPVNFPQPVLAIAKDSQDRLVIAGSFSMVNGSYRPGIARLHADGSIDLTFDSRSATTNWLVQNVAIQTDGRIVIAGVTSTSLGGSRPQIARLNADGSLDTSFDSGAGANDQILALAIEADGSILVGGKFSQFDNEPRNQLCRLLPSGAVDDSFKPARSMPWVSSLTTVAEGKILASWAGGIISFDATQPLPPPRSLIRLNRDGSLDTSLPEITDPVSSVAIEPDGKYIVAGSPLRRLYPTGEPDASFSSTIHHAANVLLDDQSRLVVSGVFGNVDGLPRPGLARLLNDASDCVSVLSFGANQLPLLETNATIAIPIFRSRNLETTNTVQVFIDPWWDVGAQRFLPLQTNLTFTPGITRQDILIPVTDNQMLEPSLQFTLCLTNPTGGAVFGADSRLDIRFIDATSQYVPGFIDPTFAPNDTSSPTAGGIAWNDKFYVTGVGTNRLFRLLADGSKDPGFSPPLFSTGVTVNDLTAISIEPDGKVLVAGPFESINQTARKNVGRINADGSLDTSFDAGDPFGNIYSSRISVIFRLPDGSYLIGGEFYQFQNQPRYGLAHISSAGSLLNDFLTTAFSSNGDSVNAIAAQPDGGILVGGYINGFAETQNLVRLSAGVVDPSFHPPLNFRWFVEQIAVQPNGKILVASATLTRLNPDGSIDPTFYFNAPVGMDSVTAMEFDANNNLLFHYTTDSYTRAHIARIFTGEYAGSGIFQMDTAVTAVENSPAILKVRRIGSASGEAHLRIKTHDVTAHAGEHYVATDTEVFFADGDSAEKQIEIPLIDNPAPADNLFFQATLSAETPGIAIAANSNVATVNIVDDESGFILTELPTTLVESPFYGASFAVRRTGPYTGPATVEVATDGGTATPGDDYEPIAKTLTFDSPTNVLQRVNLSIRNDLIPEPTKTIRVVLRNPSGGAILFEPSTNVFTLDDDADGFAFNDAVVMAGPGQSVANVLISPVSGGGTVTLHYKTEGGSAEPGIEYVPTEGTLDFSSLDMGSKSISIPLLPTWTLGDSTTILLKVTGLNGERYLSNDIATVILQHPPVIAAAGSIDNRFAPVVFSNLPTSAVVSSNWIYLAHSGDVIRFTLDGSVDESYTPEAIGPSLFTAPNGGLYTSGQTVHRLDSSGKLDPSFQPSFPEFLRIKHLLVVDDIGKIVIAGTNYLTGQPRPYILRLLPSGAVDKEFSAPSFENGFGSVTALALQSDGRILLAGIFTGIDKVPRHNLARLISGGGLDATFVPPVSGIDSVNRILVRTDGKIVASGSFNLPDGSKACVAILNSDGSFDPDGFVPFPPRGEFVILAALDGQNRAYAFQFNDGWYYPQLFFRTLPSGGIDRQFFPPPKIGQILTTPEGLVAFQQVPYGSQLIRLFTDPPTMLRPPELLPNHRIAHTFNFPANTPYVVEQTSNFQTWTEVLSGTSSDGYVQFETDAPAGNEFYRVRSE